MTRDASNARQNKRLEQIQKQYDREDDEALRAVMADTNGRTVVMALARKFKWMGDPWDPNSVRLTDYESGRRAAGLALMAWVERVDATAFMAMQQEAQDRDRAAAQVKAAALVEPVTGNPEQEQDDG